MSIMGLEFDANPKIIFDSVDELSKATRLTKIQAALPAEIMRFVVRFREGFIRSRTTSDTIAVLVIIAKNYLESLPADKQRVVIDRSLQLKNDSLESWKIQSVIPDDCLQYIDVFSEKINLKQLSPAIAVLSVIGAQKVAELSYEKDFWMSFYDIFDSVGGDPALPEWYLSWLQKEKKRISKPKVTVEGYGKVPDKLLGMFFSAFPHLLDSAQEDKEDRQGKEVKDARSKKDRS